MVGTWIHLFLLEELFCNGPPREMQMVESVWSQMPDAVVEKVLIYLPRSSQARFCTVCKRWRHLITSREFRGKTTLVAFCRGVYPCLLHLGRPTPPPTAAEYADSEELLAEKAAFDKAEDENRAIARWCKWCKVQIADLVLPRGPKRLFGGGTGVPLVGVACVYEFQQTLRIRCWLLNVPDGTSEELPALDPGWDQLHLAIKSLDWIVRLVGSTAGTDRFKVFILDSSKGSNLHTYSSSSGDWRTIRLDVHAAGPNLPHVVASKITVRALCRDGKYVVGNGAVMGWVSFDGTPVVPIPPVPRFDPAILADPERDVVFALGSGEVWLNRREPNESPGLYLYQLELDKPVAAWEWECLFSRNRPPLSWRNLDRYRRPEQAARVRVVEAQIVGHVLLVLARDWREYGTYWAMTYHLLDRSCGWQRIHPTMGARGVAKLQLFVSPEVPPVSLARKLLDHL